MTGTEYAEAVRLLGTDPESVASALGYMPWVGAQWTQDEGRGPPQPVSMFLRLAIAHGHTFDEAVEKSAGL